MMMNAAQVLLSSGDARRAALCCGAERVTYGTLRDAVPRAASVWKRRGLARGDRVAVKLPDGTAWVQAFLGALWAGGVGVAVNPRIPADEWRFIVREGGFRFILAESSDGDDAPVARDRVLALDEWTREAQAAAPVEPEAMDEEAPAFWTHSSGSSGRPKAVVHAQRFALHVERVAEELLGVTAEDRLFASSKLFFAYPLGNSLFSGLKLGATVVLDREWPNAAAVATTIREQRPTVLFSVPSLYRNLLKEGLAREVAGHGVKVCVSAGEALPATLRDEWRRQTGLTIVNGYGASETLSLVLLNLRDGEELSPAPGVALRSLSPDGRGTPTRLCIDAKTLALGYWNRPDADAESFRDGAFCPADLFARADSGAWRFAGREDSLVKIYGRWVNLVELEERLAVACPSIVEAAAVSVPDSDGVDAVAFFYVLKAGAPANIDGALRAELAALPPYRRPRWLHAVSSLPRTATGKLLRRKLPDLHHALAMSELALTADPVGSGHPAG
jgi:benzoate-CoA ligase